MRYEDGDEEELFFEQLLEILVDKPKKSSKSGYDDSLKRGVIGKKVRKKFVGGSGKMEWFSGVVLSQSDEIVYTVSLLCCFQFFLFVPNFQYFKC